MEPNECHERKDNYEKENPYFCPAFGCSDALIGIRLANAFHVSVDTLLEGVVEYEMVQTLLNATSEQLLAQELLQVVKRYIREAEK